MERLVQGNIFWTSVCVLWSLEAPSPSPSPSPARGSLISWKQVAGDGIDSCSMVGGSLGNGQENTGRLLSLLMKQCHLEGKLGFKL